MVTKKEQKWLHLDKIDFKSKTKKALHNNKRVNLPGRYNNYICTQIRTPNYMKQTLTELKGQINGNITIDFNAHLNNTILQMDLRDI